MLRNKATVRPNLQVDVVFLGQVNKLADFLLFFHFLFDNLLDGWLLIRFDSLLLDSDLV